MSEYGYYLGAVFLCSDNFIDNKGKWVAMQFEPFEQENVRKEIEEYKYIYHITPKDNIDKIKKFGFIPHEKKDDRFNYPSRTYFVYGNISSTVTHVRRSEENRNYNICSFLYSAIGEI